MLEIGRDEKNRIGLYEVVGKYPIEINIVVRFGKYENIIDIGSYYLVINKKNKYGLLDKEGREMIHCIYDSINFRSNLIAAQKNGKFALINYKNKKITSFEYDDIRCFNYGIAAVKKDGKFGFINANGEIIVPCVYDDARDFYHDFAAVKINGKWGFVNIKGEKTIQPIYDEVKDFYNYSYAIVKKGDKWGIINAEGKEIVPCKYNSLELNKKIIEAKTPNGTIYLDAKYFKVITNNQKQDEKVNEEIMLIQ